MFKKLREMILEYVETEEEITLDSNLKSDLDMTSFDIVCLCSDVESTFDVKISSKDSRELVNVGKMVQFLESSTK